MESPLIFALNISTLIIIAFSANLLILRSVERQAYIPLALCLFSIGIVICQPSLFHLLPELQPTILIFSLPAILLIAPSLWFYVEAITSKKPWRLNQVFKGHFVLAAIGGGVSILALFVPYDVRYELLIVGNDNVLKNLDKISLYVAVSSLLMTFLLVLGWVIQSGFYLYKIVKRLTSYRSHLKELFASTEVKEVRWLSWLIIAVGFVWLAAAVNIVLDNLFLSTTVNATAAGIVILVMTWSVAIWGLRQKPGFEELYNSDVDLQSVLADEVDEPEKYQRSALDKQQATKIAEKIASAMQNEKLYLDSMLSLQKLAKHIATSPNYISQTLNESLKMNFFDYVNKFRVEHAKQLLVETNDTVLDIAMNSGFNAKSSFYTAFKKDVQQTPSQYRKSASS